MELPIYPQSKLAKHVHQIFEPFLVEQPTIQNEEVIMPLYLVEKQLHEHYVNQKPLKINFEYYNQQDRIKQHTIVATVDSTVLLDRRIVLTEIDRNSSFILSIEQILTVSANID
ncbi:hypothetical protein [Fundicoccus culcitae]|uniref:YolD-like family protein n=1 Tax=Fundicoccus culcitae TaxID=2969821 RepID=A0ABY5P642_9LACT|nr:hypothetical protein [Fundicoccus culcitae]UUX34075.1 hypothetical protein NRE15_14520 [Fundicoccus culcitae]